MIDTNQILEFAGNVTNIWTFLTFLVIVLVAGAIYLYRKDNQFYTKIFSNKKVNDKILTSLKELKDESSETRKEVQELKENFEKLSSEQNLVKKNLTEIKSDILYIKQDLSSVNYSNELVTEIFNAKTFINNEISDAKKTHGVFNENINLVLNKFEGDFNILIENILVLKISNFTEFTLKEQLDRFLSIKNIELPKKQKEQLEIVIENFRSRFAREFATFSQSFTNGRLLMKFKNHYKNLVPILINQSINILGK